MERLLTELFDLFTHSAHYRDTWLLSSEFLCNGVGHCISRRTEKLTAWFDFGIFGSRFYLSTPFGEAHHLRRMDDVFWRELLSLTDCGTLRFTDNLDTGAYGGAPLNPLKSKSEVFRIIRDCVLTERFDAGNLGDLGGLEVTLPWTADWRLIVDAGARALKMLYTLNYRLYRAEYQLQHARRSSARKRGPA
jgi:hypothetical protein